MHEPVLFMVLITILQVNCDDKYTTKYDNLEIDDVLHNDRLLNNYIKCLMDEGPCTPDAAELKRVMTEALDTDCEKCSEKQKEMSEKVVKFLINSRPEIWALLESRYDPDGKYKIKYSERLTTTEKP